MSMDRENDHEEYLTSEDFGYHYYTDKSGNVIRDWNIDKKNLERINGHPLGDGDEYYPSDNFRSGVSDEIKTGERIDDIFLIFKKEKEKRNIDGEKEHIFLLPKGCYFEGKGRTEQDGTNRKRSYYGRLVDDILVLKGKGETSRLIYSFSEKGKDKYDIVYEKDERSSNPFESVTIHLNQSTKINPHLRGYLDLDKCKDANDLRNLLAKR